MHRRTQGAAAIGAASLIAALGLPGAAHAQIRLPLTVDQVVSGTVKLDPQKAATGDAQLLDTVAGVTCPSTQGVAQGLGTILDAAKQIGSLGCIVKALDLQFASEITLPSGQVVRRKQVGLVNVPTPLNVDDDPQADVIGTLKVLSLSTFELQLDRAIGETAKLPLKLEALVDSPLPGLLPRERLNVGYDARTGTAPKTWKASANLPAAAPGTTDIDITTAQTGATDLATIGGLFDGAADDRKNPMGGALTYSPAPPSATLGLTLGPKMAVRAGASAPTDLTGTAELVDGTARKDVTVALKPLPKTLEVAFEEPGADRRKVTYTASAPVKQIDATYVDSVSGHVATKVVAKAKDVPTGMTVEQTGARSGVFTATGGVLGSIEAGFADGEPKLLGEDNPYAYVTEAGDVRSFAGRIDGLQKATVDATDGVDVDVQMGADTRKKLHGVVRFGGKDIDATVRDVPRHIDFAFTPAAGTIDYDAFGETIDEIAVKATSDVPFVDRAKRIEGKITGLPSKANVKAVPGSDGFSLTTDQPIGAAEVLLSSGPDGTLGPDEVGADVTDLPSSFVAQARVHGLRQIALDVTKEDAPQPDGTTKKELATLHGKLQLASEPTVLRYDSFQTDLKAGLSSVPSDVDLTFDKDAGSLAYVADAPINEIVADVESTTPLFDEAKSLKAKIQGLPKQVTVGFKPTNPLAQGATITTDQPLGMLEAQITDGTTPAPALADGQSKVGLVKTPGKFAVAARLFAVRGGKVELVGKDVDAQLHLGPLPDGTRQDVDLEVAADVAGDAEPDTFVLNGRIDDIPNDLSIGLAGDKLVYQASSTIPKVFLDARNLPQGVPGDSLAGKPQHVRATTRDVPPRLDVDLKDIAITPTGGALGRTDFELWDSGDPAAPLPEDGRNKVSLDKRDGKLHVQGRLQAGLTSAKLAFPSDTSFKTTVETTWNTNPNPLDVALDGGTTADPSDVDLVVDELTSAQSFTLEDHNGMYLDWRANAPGTDVQLDVSGKDLGADIDVVDLPTSAQVCLGGDQQCVTDVKRDFRVNDKHVVVPTDASIHVSANGLLTVNGWVCMPPSNDEGDRQGDVYGSCIDHSATNRIEIDQLQLQQAAVGVFSGDTLTRNEDGDGPEEDELLKLYLLTDDAGIRVKDLNVRNRLTDKNTNIQAGWIEKDGHRIPGGRPMRSEGGTAFQLLADLSGIPNSEYRQGRMECDTVNVHVKILGITLDVLPFPGEAVLGDICI